MFDNELINDADSPLMGDPSKYPNNLVNPYGFQPSLSPSAGEAYFNAPESNSTMVSDSVEMTKRLKAFVPASSVKKGRQPQKDLLSASQLAEASGVGDNYKSKFQ